MNCSDESCQAITCCPPPMVPNYSSTSIFCSTQSYTATCDLNWTDGSPHTAEYEFCSFQSLEDAENEALIRATELAMSELSCTSRLPVLSASAVSTTQIDLSWSGTFPVATDWTLEYSTDGVTYTPFSNFGISTLTYSNTGLTSGTLYYYRIKAVELNGLESPYSEVATATTP